MVVLQACWAGRPFGDTHFVLKYFFFLSVFSFSLFCFRVDGFWRCGSSWMNAGCGGVSVYYV